MKNGLDSYKNMFTGAPTIEERAGQIAKGAERYASHQAVRQFVVFIVWFLALFLPLPLEVKVTTALVGVLLILL